MVAIPKLRFRRLVFVSFIMMLSAVYLYTNRRGQPFLKLKFSQRNENSINSNNSNVDVTKANAALVALCRNSDLSGMLRSVKLLESKFNHRFHYDWIFLNDEPFTDAFKKAIQQKVSGDVKFGIIPAPMWDVPQDVSSEKFAATLQKSKLQGIKYGDLVSYRQMCRFESGFFYNHELIKPYDWYWRVEPDVEFFCDITTDPFRYMEENGKSYGFIIMPMDDPATYPSLWKHVKRYTATAGIDRKLFGGRQTGDNNDNQKPKKNESGSAFELISNDKGKTFNNCHFWSNFEIAKLDFFRSAEYQEFFNYLDQTNGFFYERWGDAIIHTIAIALYMPLNQIHFFGGQFGYKHEPNQACPIEPEVRRKSKCDCRVANDITYITGLSCATRLFDMQGIFYDEEWVSEWFN